MKKFVESNIRPCRRFTLFDSSPWSFLDTGVQVRKMNFKLIFAPSLESVPVSRPNLVNIYFRDFGTSSAISRTQKQVQVIFANVACGVVLFASLLKLAFDLERLTSKFCLLPP